MFFISDLRQNMMPLLLGL